ncbi:twinfilin-1 [Capsaspora owczarzaki ATCC 30864]|uniref:Twinfilin n=1 Tax=Capsaspora owczarzaki (strain ATCC 30864) TaxID=595528 RepID=A0A0D2WPI5_CAPO3|nr:twinfilin-1 [Capsaspora owczarzaki ATCC 30864]KJE93315.1 twinfilin-1 [Capsaspora owczarzaki ATCC 30864]|eukprot:XP_004347946.1 twinfilin-1 [Capsaspora owczarzaki ATCC 30864]
MSHQSGITASRELSAYFSEIHQADNVRAIKVNISGESLVKATSQPVRGTWESDYDSCVTPLLDEKAPSYILYRLDSSNAHGYEWILICYVPDFAMVRDKMLYASTRATLKKEFGDYRVVDEVFGTAPSDVSRDGFAKHVEANNAPPPLSREEIEKSEIKAREVGVDIGASTKRAHMGAVHFPVSDAGLAKLRALQDGSVSYVQLSIDISRETIELASAENIQASQIASRIPGDQPRYHFFRFTHQHEGQRLEPIVFIYSCPGYACKIKERMLYSSGKNPILSVVEDDLGITVDKKLEVSDAAEVTEQFIFEEFHPKAVEAKKAFAKPSAPGKGGRRLLRTTEDA